MNYKMELDKCIVDRDEQRRMVSLDPVYTDGGDSEGL